MKSVLLDVERCEIDEVDILSASDYSKLLNCTYIDVARRQIGNKHGYFDIFVDDMGALKNNPVVSAVGIYAEPMLYGNLVITKSDFYGEPLDLTKEEIKHIREHISIGIAFDDNNILKAYPVLTEVAY